MRMARAIFKSYERRLAQEEEEEEEEKGHLEATRDLVLTQGGMPKNHPAQLLVKPTAGSSTTTQHRSNRLGRSPSSDVVVKRREFEQDLDNGDTSDYYRLPY